MLRHTHRRHISVYVLTLQALSYIQLYFCNFTFMDAGRHNGIAY